MSYWLKRKECNNLYKIKKYNNDRMNDHNNHFYHRPAFQTPLYSLPSWWIYTPIPYWRPDFQQPVNFKPSGQKN
jgi:hypothetical protein